MYKNILGSFSFDVAKRILNVLNEHGRSMKKTNLSSKAGLNYKVCLRYIRILNSLGWIDVNSEVSITEIGRGVYVKLLDISEGVASTGADVWPKNPGEKSIRYSWSSYISSIQTKTSSLVMDENQTVSQSKEKIDNKKGIIMIVDNEEDVALTFDSILSSVGYRVKTFIDSRSALREYVSNPFLYDLLILDIRMQDINGLQLYQSIRAINPECRAIFVSCLDAAREAVSILPGMNPQNLIRKPVSREQLVTAVKTALTQ
jgi:CheY-like chemotaxis protein/predicted transcriptional regulator